MEEVIQVQIRDTLEEVTFISAKLADDEWEELADLQRKNKKVFAWSVNYVWNLPHLSMLQVRHTSKCKTSKAKAMTNGTR